MIGTRAIETNAIVDDTLFQPFISARYESPGKKISCPVAELAVNNPITIPRFSTNQRFATVAAKTRASEPVLIPMTNPQSAINCHGADMNIVSAEPMLTEVSADITTLRIPKRSIRAAAKGATSPYTSTLIAIANEICSRPQPNASSSGIIRTDEALRNPAAVTRVKNVTPTANQAG